MLGPSTVLMMDDDKATKVEEGIAGLDPAKKEVKKTRSRMSFASMKYDRGSKGYLTDVEQKVRVYDKDGDGQIDVNEVFTIVEDVMKERNQKSMLKKFLIGSGALFILVLAANAGLMVAVLRLTREVESDGSGHLVNSKTGQTVITLAEASDLTATVDPDYLARITRRLLGGETNEDRRILESGSELVGTLPSSAVANAYTNFRTHATPIVLNVDYGLITYTELVAAAGIGLERMPDGTAIFTGFHAEDHPTPTYNVECKEDENTCVVYQKGDILSRLIEGEVSGCLGGGPGLLIGASVFVAFFLTA